jgi:peptidoglycan biosynthesis protein MviN/MurJ (putative lipid II flippase)
MKSHEETLFDSIFSSISIKILTKIVSFLRVILISYLFSVSIGVDIFSVTQGIIQIFFLMLAEGFEFLIVPYIVFLYRKSKYLAIDFTKIFFYFSLLLGIIISGVILSSKNIIFLLFASGYLNTNYINILNDFLYIMLLGAILILPLQALLSFYKAVKQFKIVFIVELLNSIFLLLVILIGYSSIYSLSLAFTISNLLLFIFVSYRFFSSDISFKIIVTKRTSFFIGKLFNLIKNIVYVSIFAIPIVIAEKNFGTNMNEGALAIYMYASLFSSFIASLPSFATIFQVHSVESLTLDRYNKFVYLMLIYSVVVVAFIFVYSIEIFSITFNLMKTFDVDMIIRLSDTFKVLSLFVPIILISGFQYRILYNNNMLNEFRIILLWSSFLTINITFIFYKMDILQDWYIVLINGLHNFITFVFMTIVLNKKLKLNILLNKQLLFIIVFFIGIILFINMMYFLKINIFVAAIIYMLLLKIIYLYCRKKILNLIGEKNG